MESSRDKIIGHIDVNRLPCLPHTLLELLKVSRSSDASFVQLAEIVGNDPALAAKFISVASSPTYSGPGKLESLKQLLVVLGLDNIKTIAITALVNQFFSRFSQEKSSFLKQYWHHSLWVANLAKSLANLTGYKPCEEAYLAGLLHDIGQLAMLNTAPGKYIELHKKNRKIEDRLEKEQEYFGANHHELGAEIIEKWGLRSVISDAVKAHHLPVESLLKQASLTKIVNLANLLASSKSKQIEQALNTGHRLFALSKSLMLDMRKNTKQSTDQIAQALDVDVGRAKKSSTRQDSSATQAILSADEKKQLQLAEEVRNTALLSGVQSSLYLPQNETGVMRSLRQSLHIMFGIRQCMFLLYRNDQNLLIAADDPDGHRVDLRVPMTEENSLATTALLKKKPVDSTAEVPHSATDNKLKECLGKEVVMALPMIYKSIPVGVLAVGFRQENYQSVLNRLTMLMMFASQAAVAIKGAQLHVEELRYREEESKVDLDNKARQTAHNISAPMSVISNQVNILGMKLDGEKEGEKELAVIVEELDRINAVVFQLADNKAKFTEDGYIDVNRLITNLMDVVNISSLQSREIELELDLLRTLPAIFTNKNSIKQILLNLIKNATEVLPRKGKITISTRDQIYLDGKSYIEISISDNGPGIPENIMAQLFKPVSSAKGTGDVGLGLTIVKNLVDELKGSISCWSNPKDGTSFTVLLPRATKL